MITLLVILALIVIVVLYFVGVYNGLVTARNAFKNAFAQIDVQLTRRYDLIPNLVETVKGYIKHERETLEAVIQARNSAVSGLKAAAANPADAGAVAQLQGAETQLGSALGRLFALSEAYPDLKANTNFQDLQKQLAETENQISFARQYYNDAVAKLNTLVRTIPWMFFTGIAGVHAREFYEAPAGSTEVPRVEF